jgi:hypothetical protein
MAQIFETGHARNVANFEKLIGYCAAHNGTYQPSKESIQLASLQTVLENARVSLADVTEKLVAYNNAIGERQLIFADFKKLATRVISALSVSGAPEKTVDHAKAVNKKIQGARSGKKATAKVKANDADMPDPNVAPSPDKSISVSQQSYDQLLEHFAKLISILQAEPTYAPNEHELQIAQLNVLHENMKNANTAAKTTQVALSNSRLKRNDILYNNTNSLHAASMDIKKYIKSIFGPISPQYKQISGIKFTAYK